MKITLTDYARAKGVSYVTAYRWVKQGKIDVTREGKYVYVNSHEGKQAYNAVVYVATKSAINHEQVEGLIEIHKWLNKARIKTTRFFYETEETGLSQFNELIECLSGSTTVILGEGARGHIEQHLGKDAADIVFNILKSDRRMIDMEKDQ